MKQKPEPEDKEKNEKYYDKVSHVLGRVVLFITIMVLCVVNNHGGQTVEGAVKQGGWSVWWLWVHVCCLLWWTGAWYWTCRVHKRVTVECLHCTSPSKRSKSYQSPKTQTHLAQTPKLPVTHHPIYFAQTYHPNPPRPIPQTTSHPPLSPPRPNLPVTYHPDPPLPNSRNLPVTHHPNLSHLNPQIYQSPTTHIHPTQTL